MDRRPRHSVDEAGNRYMRAGSCWAKISGKRGRWHVALGWRGEFKASDVQTVATRQHAEVIARGWLADWAFPEQGARKMRDSGNE